MGKKVTMEDIAEKLELSKSLVSRAINDKYGVNDETRSRIKLAALQMGYQFPAKSPIAASKVESVTLVVDRHDITDVGFWGRIINSIEKHLNRQGISVFLSIRENEDDQYVPLSIQQMKTSGAIFLGQIPLKVVLPIASAGLPVAWVDSNYPKIKVDHITVNNYLGSYEATMHLIQKGHRQIGFIGSAQYSYSFSERFRGFSECLREHQCCDPADFSISDMHDSIDVPFNSKKLRMTAKAMNMPTAYVCGNDVTALIAHDILQEAGVKIPEDVSLIGFDNIQKCEWVEPTLSTVDIPKEQMGEIIVEILLKRIKNPDRAMESVMIATSIVQRESVRNIHIDVEKIV